ncbi:cation transporter [Bacteroidia bacterium]|nr:cation transporter [Bacteroidia bacterium]GHT26893.1 cation transporter [Bacteroidia bacterium]GHU83480.1 cation transporter [Bacteroidia bacterium]
MIRFLITRPIAVFMAFTAFFILGVITYLNVPVSLLPDIAIPEITVQVSGKNQSARELENTVVSPIRQQLLQIGKMRDIRTETRDGNAIIRLSFEYGVNTDLAFIEVNEKIDAAMNYIPREVERPRVIKASATDIPVFNLNLTLKEDGSFNQGIAGQARNDNSDDLTAFLDMCELSETVIKRQIEQLPEIAMVDVTGLINKEVLIQPDNKLLATTGIELSEIESALNNNNIEPGSMIVRDGFYEYNIKFSAVLRTVEDIQNIYLRKNNKIFQLKDLAQIEIAPEKEKGLALYNGKRAITLAIIKQADENMSKMQGSLNKVIDHLKKSYPEIEFDVSQNQTELLDYTISNLQQNLILAFIFVCLVSIIFMRDVKSPLIIGLCMFISLIISLMFFYLFHVSLNVVSLTGLILALGMMIDNSIIVTDNIGQYRQKGLSIDEACIKGTNEVIAPMLSSVFTTISVFVPLIFLSGIAGAIFYDQAFSVTAGLLVSYVTGIMLLPVLYKIVFSTRKAKAREQAAKDALSLPLQPEPHEEKISVVDKFYDAGIEWVFAHKVLTTIIMIGVLPLCFWMFNYIPKEKMPDISQNELLVNIEWNENIHIGENDSRTRTFLAAIDSLTIEHSALIAQQQFLLNREREQTSSECQVYLKTPKKKDIHNMKKTVETYFSKHYPDAIITFSPMGTIFEKIFTTGEPDLTVEYYVKNRTEAPDAQAIRTLENEMKQATGEAPSGVSFQKQLNLHIDREKLLLYKVSYNEVYQALRTGFKENQFSVLRSYQQYLPIVLGSEEQNVREVIDNILIYTSYDEYGQRNRLPLSAFISTTPAEDLKTIVAGKNGEYVPMEFYDTQQVEKIMRVAKENVSQSKLWEVDFSGTFFSNRKMINELLIILFISILLMFFILAAQFESFVQPLIVLLEIPIDVAASIGLLIVLGHTLNLMSAIGIVVTCGIIINDSILKVDMMNQLRREGYPLMVAIHEAGRRRLKAILMTSLTSIVCMAPLLFSYDMGSELEKPLAIATIGGMIIGTPVSLFVVPLVYWRIYRNKELKD